MVFKGEVRLQLDLDIWILLVTCGEGRATQMKMVRYAGMADDQWSADFGSLT